MTEPDALKLPTWSMLWQHAAISSQGQGEANDALTQRLVAGQLQALCQIRRQEAQLEDLQGAAQQVSQGQHSLCCSGAMGTCCMHREWSHLQLLDADNSSVDS